MAEREARTKPKKSVIGTFLGRLSRSKSRGADVDRKKQIQNNEHSNVPSSKSDGNIKNSNRRSSETSHRETAANFLAEEAAMSPARRLLNRFSNLRSTGRFRSSSRASTEGLSNPATPNGFTAKTTSEHDLLAVGTKPPSTKVLQSGVPTGAQSETDLRFVTTRDSHRSIPLDDSFSFGDKSPRAFMSETDLSSGSADFPEVNRTPSYLRISCALNGYTRSPKVDLTPKAAPIESLVERRARMFSQPQQRQPAPGLNSPITTTSSVLTSESKTSVVECLTPVAPVLNNRLNALQKNEMGNHVSTPGPIRDLISKFDQLDLCHSHKNEKEGVENIEPHKFIINQQPVFDEIDLKKDPNGNEEVPEVPPLKISTDAESDSGISGSSPASSKKNMEVLKDTKEDEEQEVTTSTPSDGHEFRSLHDKVKAELQEKMDAAHKDLENADDLPEKCADSLRAAHGNAHLLVRKKFAKFNELIGKNLNPIADDPMPVTVQDLEGFWMTIDMELKGIQNEFIKVEKYRAANWDPSAVEEEQVDTTTVVPKTRPVTAKKKPVPVVSDETKKKLAEQKALAEQRRAEMRAQMRQKMKAKNQEETDSSVA